MEEGNEYSMIQHREAEPCSQMRIHCSKTMTSRISEDWKAFHKIACYIKVLVSEDINAAALENDEPGDLDALETILTGFNETSYLSIVNPEVDWSRLEPTTRLSWVPASGMPVFPIVFRHIIIIVSPCFWHTLPKLLSILSGALLLHLRVLSGLPSWLSMASLF
jgi:hypothetical protein